MTETPAPAPVPARTEAHLPTWRQIGMAILVGIYTCAMTFFAGLIGQGIDLEHWPDWRIAAQAGIAAALAAIGWTGIAASRRGPP